MALMKYGIPNDVSKDRRVIIKYWDSEWNFLSAFGLTHPKLEPTDIPLKDMYSWIRENCSGYVYNIIFLDKNEDQLVEFFFKTVADAVMFKMHFS